MDKSETIIQRNTIFNAQILKSPENIAGISEDWDDLFSRAMDASPHLSRTWVSTFIQESHLRGKPLFILVWREGKLVALLPLAVRKFFSVKIAEPIGTGEPSYLGLLADPDYPAVIEYIAELISSERIFDVYYSADLSSEDSATNELLTELARRGYSRRQTFRNPCHYIRLGCSFDEYLKNKKSGKSRQTIRRKERMLCKNKEVEQEYYAGIEVTPQIISRIAAIQQESWMKRRGAAVLSQPFYQKLLIGMAQAGFGHVWLLRINNEDIAFVYAYIAHRNLNFAWTAFKMKYRISGSVGMVLTSWTIRKACEEGILSYDFGHGDAEYKRFWSTGSYDVYRMLAGGGVRGHLVMAVCSVPWRLAKKKWLRLFYKRLKRLFGR